MRPAYYNRVHSPTWVVRRRQSQRERLEYLDNGLTYNHQILHGNWHRNKHSTAKPDMMSPIISGRKLSRKPMASVEISRERFKRGSPNFTNLIGGNRSRKPVGYDVTSYFRSAFIEVRKNGRKCRLRQLWAEFLHNGLSDDDEKNLSTYWGQLASQVCRIWHHWLIPVGCKLQLNTP